MKISLNTLALVALCGCLALLSSCSGKTSTGGKETDKPLESLSSLVVLPSEVSSGKSGRQNDENISLRKGADFVDLTMVELMNDYRTVRALSAHQVAALMDEDNAEGATDVIGHLGKILHCDAVMQITVHRYRQRVGGELAAESPASASFQMRLVDVKTRAVLWSSDFDETQESLLSNILSFNKAQSRGFKWISVETMVSQGLKERIARCPYLKK